MMTSTTPLMRTPWTGVIRGFLFLLPLSCVQETRSRWPESFRRFELSDAHWSSERPSPTRGAESAVGPRPFRPQDDGEFPGDLPGPARSLATFFARIVESVTGEGEGAVPCRRRDGEIERDAGAEGSVRYRQVGDGIAVSENRAGFGVQSAGSGELIVIRDLYGTLCGSHWKSCNTIDNNAVEVDVIGHPTNDIVV